MPWPTPVVALPVAVCSVYVVLGHSPLSLQPFWPTGSGLGRGFLGALDAAWMMKGFGEGKPAMDLIEEREATLQLLSQTKPERLSKNFQSYTINPTSRYLDMRGVVPLGDLSHLHDTGLGPQRPTEIIRSGLASKRTDSDKGKNMCTGYAHVHTCTQETHLYAVHVE